MDHDRAGISSGYVREAKPGGRTAPASGIVPVRVRANTSGVRLYQIFAIDDVNLETPLHPTVLAPQSNTWVGQPGNLNPNYETPIPGEYGIAFISYNGQWVLYAVGGERVVVETCSC